MGYARQRITRTIVVTRSRTRTSGTNNKTSKVKKTSKRCPSCGRYI